MKRSLFLPLLCTALVAGALPPGRLEALRAQEGARILQSQKALEALRSGLALDADSTFQLRRARTDELGQTHGRFQQRYKGLRVFGGEAITHLDAEGRLLPFTNALKGNIHLNATPSIEAAEALGIAHRDLAPKGAYDHAPSAELVVFPMETEVVKAGRAHGDLDATGLERQVVRYALAWYIRAELMNGTEETRSQDYLIDAHTGAILKRWDSLQTGAAVGSGHSQWYGAVSLNTNNTGVSAYEMRDLTRGNTTVVGAVGNATTNLDHKTSGTGAIYTDPDNDWGDGNMYGSGTTVLTTSATGQTAAVDAHRGLQATWDFYGNVFGRNGIDDTGKATYNRMHYSKSYDNAFWQDSCFCMTYGDGDPANGGSVGEADLDTAGHEMSHGVCANEANLTYSGESGGLNESDSDIFGTMVEFYTLGGGAGATIPDSASINVGGTIISANYKMFENSWGHPAPNDALRWMYRPDLDGASPDYWYSGVGSLDVHYSSGPNNRFFYFLAAGATTSGDTSTAINVAGNGVSSPDFLPDGMTGIGNDSAARIWYRALTTYLTASSDYAAARAAALSAAADLFGATSFEYYTVQNAYHGINVGAAASTTAVKATITLPASNITINSGASVSFAGTAVDTIPSTGLSYAWTFGDGASASGASTSHIFTNGTGSDVAYTVTFTATDAHGASASRTVQVTVHGADATAPTGSFDVRKGGVTVAGTTTSGTLTFTGSASDTGTGVQRVTFYIDGAFYKSIYSAPYTTTWDTTRVANGKHTVLAYAMDNASNMAYLSPKYISFTTSNPDVVPPTGTVSVSGATGTISFNATATDVNGSVARVTFYVDGVFYRSITTPPYTVTFDSTGLSNGTHRLNAWAVDTSNNLGNLSPYPLSFNVSNATLDSTAPTLSNVAVTGTTGTVTLGAMAKDDHLVMKVEFYVDGVLKGTDTSYTSPTGYSVAWPSTPGGHTLVVKAYDGAGNVATSANYPFTTN